MQKYIYGDVLLYAVDHTIKWSVELGINYGTLRSRLDDFKWSIEKAFNTPVKENL